MSRVQTQKIFVRTLTVMWAVVFVLACGLGAFGLFGSPDMFGEYSALSVFLGGHFVAGLIALAVMIIASGTHSQSVRRLANVPIAGTGMVALCSASLGAFLAVLS